MSCNKPQHKPSAAAEIVKHWAESFGALYGSTYICRSADGGLFSLTRLQDPNQPAHGNPVIMIPGMFTKRNFWCSPKGVGIGAYLCREGYDVWLFERRGLGESPKAQEARKGLNECATIDLPAAQAFIKQKNNKPSFWLGHSFGGVIAAAAIAEAHLDPSSIAGLCTFGSQLSAGKLALNPPNTWLTPLFRKLFHEMPSAALGFGPENEPWDAISDSGLWVSMAKKRGNFRFWKNFQHINVAALCISSTHDKVDPWKGCFELYEKLGSENKQWRLLGKSEGDQHNYDHPGMVISKAAQQEIWPFIAQWLKQH